MNAEEILKNTIDEMRTAINERNLEKLTRYVDVKKFLDDGYDEVTDELAQNCDKFHKLYPHDLFFKFGARALRFYNSNFRKVHLSFIVRVINAYFDKNLTPPKSFTAAPINYCAVELSKMLQALTSNVKKITVEKSRAVAEVEIFGDNSYYGKIWGSLNFKFEFIEVGEVWQLKQILNVRELVAPVLDMAERFWPSEWDLGIKI